MAAPQSLMFHKDAFAYVMCQCGHVFQSFGADAYDQMKAELSEHQEHCDAYKVALKFLEAREGK